MCVPELTPHSRQAGHTVGVSGYQPVPGMPINLLEIYNVGILTTFVQKRIKTHQLKL